MVQGWFGESGTPFQSSSNANWKLFYRRQFSGSGFDRVVITKMRIYKKETGSCTNCFRLGIYSDNAGLPDQLLGYTVIFSMSGTNLWIEADMEKPCILEDGKYYWLGHVTNTNNVYYGINYKTLDTQRNDDTFADGFSDPFGSPELGNEDSSIQAGYDPAILLTENLSLISEITNPKFVYLNEVLNLLDFILSPRFQYCFEDLLFLGTTKEYGKLGNSLAFNQNSRFWVWPFDITEKMILQQVNVRLVSSSSTSGKGVVYEKIDGIEESKLIAEGPIVSVRKADDLFVGDRDRFFPVPVTILLPGKTYYIGIQTAGLIYPIDNGGQWMKTPYRSNPTWPNTPDPLGSVTLSYLSAWACSLQIRDETEVISKTAIPETLYEALSFLDYLARPFHLRECFETLHLEELRKLLLPPVFLTETLSLTKTLTKKSIKFLEECRWGEEVAGIEANTSTAGTDAYLQIEHPSQSAWDSGNGQSFIPTKTFKLTKVIFQLRVQGSTPSGTLAARLYKHCGTFGSSSKPCSDIPLAESDPLTIQYWGSWTPVEFIFSNPPIVEEGIPYIIAVIWKIKTGGDNVPMKRGDGYEGNASKFENNNWVATGAIDLYFYMSGLPRLGAFTLLDIIQKKVLKSLFEELTSLISISKLVHPETLKENLSFQDQLSLTTKKVLRETLNLSPSSIEGLIPVLMRIIVKLFTKRTRVKQEREA